MKTGIFATLVIRPLNMHATTPFEVPRFCVDKFCMRFLSIALLAFWGCSEDAAPASTKNTEAASEKNLSKGAKSASEKNLFKGPKAPKEVSSGAITTDFILTRSQAAPATKRRDPLAEELRVRFYTSANPFEKLKTEKDLDARVLAARLAPFLDQDALLWRAIWKAVSKDDPEFAAKLTLASASSADALEQISLSVAEAILSTIRTGHDDNRLNRVRVLARRLGPESLSEEKKFRFWVNGGAKLRSSSVTKSQVSAWATKMVRAEIRTNGAVCLRAISEGKGGVDGVTWDGVPGSDILSCQKNANKIFRLHPALPTEAIVEKYME